MASRSALLGVYLFAFFALTSTLAQSSSASDPQELKLTIAAGTADGVYDKIARRIIAHLTGKNSKLSLDPVKVGGGSILNLEELRKGTVDLAFVQSDWVYKWYYGKSGKLSADSGGCLDETTRVAPEVLPEFPDVRIVRLNDDKGQAVAAFQVVDQEPPRERFPDVRVVRPLYPAYLQVFAKNEIKKLEDLKGKVVAIGKLKSASQFHARQLLSHAGIFATCVPEGMDLEKNGTSKIFEKHNVDAVIISGTLRDQAQLDKIIGKGKVHSLPYKSVIDSLAHAYPYYVVDDDVAVDGGATSKLTIPTMLVTRMDVPRNKVKKLTDALIDFREETTGPAEQSVRSFYKIDDELASIRIPRDSENGDAVKRSPTVSPPTSRASPTRLALQIPLRFHAGSCESFQEEIYRNPKNSDVDPKEFKILGTKSFSAYTRIINSFTEQACSDLFNASISTQSSELSRLVIRPHEEGKGTEGNLKKIASSEEGESDESIFAFAQNDCAYDARENPWWIKAARLFSSSGDTREGSCAKLEISSLSAVLPISRIHLQFIARKEAGIAELRDLNAKRVHIGSGISALHTERIRKEAHLRWIEKKATDSEKHWCKRLRDGEVDAVFLPGVFRSPDYLLRECGAVHIAMPPSLISRMLTKYPYYHQSDAPRELEGAEFEGKFLTLRLFLLASEGTKAEQVETLASALQESWSSLQDHDEHLVALKEAVKATPVPYHDGAARVLEKAGLIAETGHYWLLYTLLTLALITVYVSSRNESSYNRLGEINFIARNFSFYQRVFDRIAPLSSVLVIMIITVLAIITLNIVVRELESWDAAAHAVNNELLGLSDTRAFTWLFGFMASGYEDDIFPHSTPAKFFISVLALIGLVGPITLIYGYVNRGRDRKMRSARGEESFKHRDHVVICGWNDKARGLIYALTGDQAPEKQTVIILTRFGEKEPLKRLRFDRRFVFYVRGDGTTRSDLSRANVHRARAAMVLDDMNAGSNSAFNSALTAFAVRKMNRKIFVAAELSALTKAENFSSADSSASIATIDAEQIGSQMLALSCITDHVVEFLLEVMTFDKFAEWYAETPSALSQHLPRELDPKTPRHFAEALTSVGMNLIGIDHGSDESGSRNTLTFTADGLDFLLDEDTLDRRLSDDCRIIYASDADKSPRKKFKTGFDTKEIVINESALPVQDQRGSILIVGVGSRPERLRDSVLALSPDLSLTVCRLEVSPDTGLIETTERLEEILENKWERIVVLASTSNLYSLNSAEANQIDGQTILLANQIGRNRGNAIVVAELQRVDNRPLLKDAGADIIVSVPLIVERLMGLTMFGYAAAARMTMALTSSIQPWQIGQFKVQQQSEFVGRRFSDLLMTHFSNGRIIGWLPAREGWREKLRNTEGDFDSHFVACPSQEDEIAPDDYLITIRVADQFSASPALKGR